jgi:hypothetical protein
MADSEVQLILQELAGIRVKLDQALKQNVDHEERIRNLENKGGGRWEKFIDFILAAGVGALITGIASQFKN